MPSPKAPAKTIVHWVTKRHIELDLTSFFDVRKKDLPELAEDEVSKLIGQVADAIASYVSQTSLKKRVKIEGTNTSYDPRSVVTLAERNKAVKKIVKTAARVRKAVNDPAALKREIPKLEKVYRAADINTTLYVQQSLQMSTDDFYEMIAQLRLALVSDDSINLLERLAAFVPSQPFGQRWSNPALALLISQLAPLWKVITGYSCKRTNSSMAKSSKGKGNVLSNEAKHYRFAEAVMNVLKSANAASGLGLDQIDKIVKKMF